jgi:uncharacterized RDD family membrane protein YckC
MEVVCKYQTFWPRFWARCIDCLVFVPLYFVDAWVQGMATAPVVLAMWFALNAFSADAYGVLMHARYGQTLGKMLMGVKVLDLSEAKLSFRQAVLRDVVPIVFSLIAVANGLPRIFAGLEPYAETSDFSWNDKIYLFGSLVWFAAEFATMLTNAKRRAIHDFIAGSVVARVNCLGVEATGDAAA